MEVTDLMLMEAARPRSSVRSDVRLELLQKAWVFADLREQRIWLGLVVAQIHDLEVLAAARGWRAGAGHVARSAEPPPAARPRRSNRD